MGTESVLSKEGCRKAEATESGMSPVQRMCTSEMVAYGLVVHSDSNVDEYT